MSLEKLLKQAKTELADLESATSTARKRKEIATIEAGNLENRNKLAVEAIEQEVARRKQALLEPLQKEIVETKSQITKLKTVKSGLQDEISLLSQKKPVLVEKLSGLDDELTLRKADIRAANDSLKEINEAIDSGRQMVLGLKAKEKDLLNQIRELEDRQSHLNEDITLLGDEAESLEHRIIDQDAEFKSRKQEIDKELESMQTRLQVAIYKVLETEKKDKDIRKSWAEGMLNLEKREKVIRKREVLLADSDTRLREADDFMKI